jgi:OmpA-OmpF porin, OOP family
MEIGMIKRASFVLFGLGALAATSAVADGFYFGISGGVTSADLSKNDFDEAFVSAFQDELAADSLTSGYALFDAESTLDDSDKGWGIQVGYRWGSYIAAEVGYVDLGKALYQGQVQFQNSTPPVGLPSAIIFDSDARFVSRGPMASLLGIFPVSEQFDVYARAGLYFADTRVRVRSVIVMPDAPSSLVSDEVKSSSSDLLFGLGATWHINDSYSVRVEYQRFADVGDSDEAGETDVDLISVGFLFR